MVKKYTKAVFLFMVLLTINFMFWQVSRIAGARNAKNNLVTRATLQANYLSDRLESIEDSLLDAERFFRNSTSVERNEFRDFMETGAVDGFLYVEIVPLGQVAAFEQQVRQDKTETRFGYPYFKAQINSENDRHYLVKYFEPSQKWKHLFGYDIGLDDRLVFYFRTAVSERKTVLTEELPFFNASRMFAIRPVCPSTGNEPCQGFIVAVVKGDSLFDGLIAPRGKSRIEVYAADLDGQEIGKAVPFYRDSSSIPFTGKEKNLLERYEQIRFLDTAWTMKLTADAESALLNESDMSDLFFVAITVIGFILFWYTTPSLEDTSARV